MKIKLPFTFLVLNYWPKATYLQQRNSFFVVFLDLRMDIAGLPPFLKLNLLPRVSILFSHYYYVFPTWWLDLLIFVLLSK